MINLRAAYHLLDLALISQLVKKEVLDLQTWHESLKQLESSTPILKKDLFKAVTMSYDDLVKYGSEKACKEAGRLCEEGKEYVVQDGDIMEFVLMYSIVKNVWLE